MNTRNYDIAFTVFSSGEECPIKTYEGEYRNLMHLITDKIFVEDFGDCKGMGRCGTCLVEVSGLKGPPDNRLACQILIDEHLNDATVRIINDWEQ